MKWDEFSSFYGNTEAHHQKARAWIHPEPAQPGLSRAVPLIRASGLLRPFPGLEKGEFPGADPILPLLSKPASDGLFPGGARCSGEGRQPLGDRSALCLPR